MDNKSLKITSLLLNGFVLFTILYLTLGYKLQIESTLYGVFGNLLGGFFVLAAPSAIVMSFLWFRAEKWKFDSLAFLSFLFSLGAPFVFFYP